jgi:hypothetical protein
MCLRGNAVTMMSGLEYVERNHGATPGCPKTRAPDHHQERMDDAQKRCDAARLRGRHRSHRVNQRTGDALCSFGPRDSNMEGGANMGEII